MSLINGSPKGAEDNVSQVIDDIHQDIFEKRIEVLGLLKEIHKSKNKKQDRKNIQERIELLNDLQKNFNEIINSHQRMVRYHKVTGTQMKGESESLLKALENIKSSMGSIEQIIPKT